MSVASGFYDAGVGRFVVSPGFGGLATGAAAAVAFLVWNSNRRTSVRQRWMDTLRWVYDAATVKDKGEMPYAIAIPILHTLAEQARGSLEKQIVRGLIRTLTDRARGGLHG